METFDLDHTEIRNIGTLNGNAYWDSLSQSNLELRNRMLFKFFL